MITVDFAKPIQVGLGVEIRDGDAYVGWQDATYIGPYQSKHVIADAEGEYHTVCGSSLRNKPAKPTTKDVYDKCVRHCLSDGFGWASQETILDMLYLYLVDANLIKEES